MRFFGSRNACWAMASSAAARPVSHPSTESGPKSAPRDGSCGEVTCSGGPLLRLGLRCAGRVDRGLRCASAGRLTSLSSRGRLIVTI